MNKYKYRYILRLQFLGFRYHGWQPQKDVKTVQFMLERTLKFVFKHDQFKVLGASRTDAMVSALDFSCQLFTHDELNLDSFFKDLNRNLPMDIRCMDVYSVDEKFNIIQDVKTKEYHYYFSFGEKPHPYSAPFSTHVHGELDIDKMMRAATLYQGTHNFINFAYRTNPEKNYEREITKSLIEKNELFQGPLFSKNSYVFKACGNGFAHHQVRIMMSTLILLGQGVLSEDYIKEALLGKEVEKHTIIAPASGLHLFKVTY